MSLKRELANPQSALRVWMDRQPIPIKQSRQALVEACRSQIPILPDPDLARSEWSLLGNAIGSALVWHLDRTLPRTARLGSSLIGCSWLSEFEAAWTAGPTGDAVHDGPLATVAGVFERFTRSPHQPGSDPIHDSIYSARDLREAVGCVPEWMAVDVAAVAERGVAALGPPPHSMTVGPTFTGSGLVGGADADFIASNVLWDVKAMTKPELRARDLHQLIGYALLDFDDTFELRRAGLCCARYGVAMTWDLDWLVGGDLPRARHEVRTALEQNVSRAD